MAGFYFNSFHAAAKNTILTRWIIIKNCKFSIMLMLNDTGNIINPIFPPFLWRSQSQIPANTSIMLIIKKTKIDSVNINELDSIFSDEFIASRNTVCNVSPWIILILIFGVICRQQRIL